MASNRGSNAKGDIKARLTARRPQQPITTIEEDGTYVNQTRSAREGISRDLPKPTKLSFKYGSHSAVSGLLAAGTIVVGAPIWSVLLIATGALCYSMRKKAASSDIYNAARRVGVAITAATSAWLLTGGSFVGAVASVAYGASVAFLRIPKGSGKSTFVGAVLGAAMTYGAVQYRTPEPTAVAPTPSTVPVNSPTAQLANNFAATAHGLKPLAANDKAGYTITVPKAPVTQPQ